MGQVVDLLGIRFTVARGVSAAISSACRIGVPFGPAGEAR